MPGMKKSKGYAKGGAKMMKAMGGKMAKGNSKMMTARGGKMANKMAKGMSKGGAKMKTMTVAQLRAAAKKKGYKIIKA
tara:strand:- start:68 stop:301 length:234 start_codon:yes stop_codon:yes gene_type:complete